jgi:tRNA (guanine-N(7)-)-methyltransferase subunit TRM82
VRKATTAPGSEINFVSNNFSCIVTSDRDEKIRVTNYPDVHEIGAFCVGHKEYVSSALFFDNENLLLSASGDKTLRFWNFKNGKQVQLINLHFVPVSVVLSTITDSKGVMGISSDDNSFYIYSYQIVSSDAVKIHLMGQKSYSGDFDFAIQDRTIFIKHIQEADGKRKLLLDKATTSANAATFESFADVTEVLDVALDPDFKIFKPFDVSLLFKKKFDNVKQYIDRKKARIENLQTKRLKKN